MIRQLTVNGFTYEAEYADDFVEHTLLQLLSRLDAMQKRKGRRILVFLAAPPAVGKSTLVTFLAALGGERGIAVQAAGLDGFHFPNAYLRSHVLMPDGTVAAISPAGNGAAPVCLASIKGSPETFDTGAFGEKLRELTEGGTVRWPVYDRRTHEPRQDAALLNENIILIEGNWLLLDEEPWAEIRRTYADLTILATALTDSLGNLRSNYTTDGLHPDYYGKKYIGEQVGRYLQLHFSWITNTLTKKPIPTYSY